MCIFHVKADDDYGRLSGKHIDELDSGARIEVNSFKKDPLDFVLWKASKETNRPGNLRGVTAVLVGTSSVPPCPPNVWGTISTFTVADWT